MSWLRRTSFSRRRKGRNATRVEHNVYSETQKQCLELFIDDAQDRATPEGD